MKENILDVLNTVRLVVLPKSNVKLKKLRVYGINDEYDDYEWRNVDGDYWYYNINTNWPLSFIISHDSYRDERYEFIDG